MYAHRSIQKISLRPSPPAPPAPRGAASGLPQVHLRRCLPGGRNWKWMTEEMARGGGQALKWEAELTSPNDDGFDLKWKWEAKSKPGATGKAKTKWGTEEASKDDKKKPAKKCVQSKEIPAGCDVQIEVLSRKDEILWGFGPDLNEM